MVLKALSSWWYPSISVFFALTTWRLSFLALPLRSKTRFWNVTWVVGFLFIGSPPRIRGSPLVPVYPDLSMSRNISLCPWTLISCSARQTNRDRRATGRDRLGWYVLISVVGVSLKKINNMFK